MSICIRPYKDKDFEVLEKIRNDFHLQHVLLTNPKPNNKKRVLQWIENKSAGEKSVFFVISNEKEETIGYVQAVNIDTLNRNCYIGIVIDKNWRGKGVFKPSIQLIEKYLKNTYNIHKIIAEILHTNIESLKAFQKNHYEKIGTFKNHFYFNEEFHDVCIFEKMIDK